MTMETERIETERIDTEIAHVLFMDLVQYSLQSIEGQARRAQELEAMVRLTREYRRAEELRRVVVLNTGDGLAMAFFGDPTSPVHCAVELAELLSASPHLRLRMGVNSGPVTRRRDINGSENIHGGGINVAQRVMDCGDAGHILLSRRCAEDLMQYDHWAAHLRDLGEHSVKHNQPIHLYNLVLPDRAGNPMLPEKVQNTSQATEWSRDKAAQNAASGFAVNRADSTLTAALPTQAVVGANAPNVAAVPVTYGISGANSYTGSAAPASRSMPPVNAPIPDRQVAILYRRNVPELQTVLELLERELPRRGYPVFIDRNMAPGVTWAQELPRQVRGSYAVIPLLSPQSIGSEMLEQEILTAHQAAQVQSGLPRLLPVRVNYEGPLPDPLAHILDPIQYTLWQGAQDSERVVTQIMAALEQKSTTQRLVPREKLEAIGGAMPLDSRFYIVRPTDDEFNGAIARGDSIVLVKGARQMGKTSLLARGLKQARDNGAKCVRTDLQKLNATQLESVETLFLSLAEMIADQLDLDVVPEDVWNPRRGANVNFERFLRREVLSKQPGHVVWALDEVDRLFTCSFGSEVFGLFRSWHNERSLDPDGPWSKLTMAIAYATEAHLFITDLNQSPFNIGTRLTLDDFNRSQTGELNARYGSPLVSADEVTRFHNLLGGQPYLVRRGLDTMVSQDMNLDVLEASADRDDGVFGDHLRRLLITLTQDNELTEEVKCVLQGQPCTRTSSFYRLRSAGILAGGIERECGMRCELYTRYLTRHLMPATGSQIVS